MALDNKDNLFVELAKVKSSPIPIKVETDDSMVALPEDETEGQLLVDVYQDGDDIVVLSALAGVTDADLDVNITTDSVTIRGTRKRTQTIEEKDYFYQECYWGKFSRSIMLPSEVDPEKSTAVVKNGILTVRMPKLSKQKTKKVKVKITE